jgi:uncharacterized protein (DUF2236 family)
VKKHRTKLPPPTRQIQFDDGITMLVPQTSPQDWILFESYVNATAPDLPSHTDVLHWVYEQANSNAPQRTDPLWARVCVWAGMLLLLVSGLAVLALGHLR